MDILEDEAKAAEKEQKAADKAAEEAAKAAAKAAKDAEKAKKDKAAKEAAKAAEKAAKEAEKAAEKARKDKEKAVKAKSDRRRSPPPKQSKGKTKKGGKGSLVQRFADKASRGALSATKCGKKNSVTINGQTYYTVDPNSNDKNTCGQLCSSSADCDGFMYDTDTHRCHFFKDTGCGQVRMGGKQCFTKKPALIPLIANLFKQKVQAVQAASDDDDGEDDDEKKQKKPKKVKKTKGKRKKDDDDDDDD